jgi:hypothetical protein
LRFGLAPDLEARLVDAWPAELEALAARLVPAPDRSPARERAAAQVGAGAGMRLWIALDLPPGSRVAIARAVDSPRYGVILPAAVLTACIPAGAEVRTTALLWPAPPGAGP